MTQPIQRIIFGSPGTGKSHLIKSDIIPYELGIDEKENPENMIKAVFHPEYTYGDFMGKLLPITRAGQVEYNFYEGHFLKALAQAYKNMIVAHDKNGQKLSEPENVVLVIDEINRGNSSAIFGSIFQLLDRNDDGWSSYDTSINGVTFFRLLELIGFTFSYDKNQEIDEYKLKGFDNAKKLETFQPKLAYLNFDLVNKTIKIPPNLHIIATMNTSDSSIYHMDTAFKRRWEWQFIDVDSELVKTDGIAFKSEGEWIDFIKKLNQFIKSNHNYIRGIEDKQIGRYFIKGNSQNQIEYSIIQSKLMFFIWDSVFNRDKTPLVKLLFGNDNVEQNKNKLVTFGDFALQVEIFVEKIKKYENNNV